MTKPNCKNRTLFHGDNLDFLRSLNTGCIHLIATDPPFNKGRDFHATPGSLAEGASFKDRWRWEQDVHDDWVDSIKDDWPAVWRCIDHARHVYGDDMGAFLCFLGIRMIEMHRVLRDDGSIYLHCDPTASHYIKTLMDAVFGRKQFHNDITWKRTSAHSDSGKYGKNTDCVLFYSKGKEKTWNQIYTPYPEEYLSRFRHVDPNGRKWQDGSLSAKGLQGGGYEYSYKGTKGYWRCPIQTMKKLDKQNRLYFTRNGGIRVKKYLDESKGYPPQALWDDIKVINSQAKERTGYPTQKPLALYERIIQASSNEGDWILDPFCGCATTPVAAERLGRKWIGMDLWNQSLGVLAYRFRRENIKIAEGDAILKEFRDLLQRKKAKSKGEKKMLKEVESILNQPPIPGLERGTLTFTDEPPRRTTNGSKVPEIFRTPEGKIREKRASREAMFKELLDQQGLACKGCDYEVRGPWDFHLDHRIPRSEGGGNEIQNRMLLCHSCNQTKSNKMTLTGLRAWNKKHGRMAS